MSKKTGLVSVIAILLVAAVLLVEPAAARSHHHRRRHRHHHPPPTTTTIATTSTTTPPPTGAGCTAAPNPATLVTPGLFSASLECHGLGNMQAVAFSSPSLALACTSVSLGGTGTASARLTSDALGRATLTVQGGGCVPATTSIVVSEATFSLSVPLRLVS